MCALDYANEFHGGKKGGLAATALELRSAKLPSPPHWKRINVPF